jgi:hypothetical protein
MARLRIVGIPGGRNVGVWLGIFPSTTDFFLNKHSELKQEGNLPNIIFLNYSSILKL